MDVDTARLRNTVARTAANCAEGWSDLCLVMGGPLGARPYVRALSLSTRTESVIFQRVRPRCEVVHPPPVDHDAPGGVCVARGHLAAVRSRAPHPRRHLAHRGGGLLLEGRAQ